MSAVRALEFERGNNFFSCYKGPSADRALELSTAAGVVVDILVRSPAEGAYSICGDSTPLVFVGLNRFSSFAITEAVILVPELAVLFDERFDNGKFIGKELWVFRAVEFIVNPLLERNISADEKNKPANLVRLFLNDMK